MSRRKRKRLRQQQGQQANKAAGATTSRNSDSFAAGGRVCADEPLPENPPHRSSLAAETLVVRQATNPKTSHMWDLTQEAMHKVGKVNVEFALNENAPPRIRMIATKNILQMHGQHMAQEKLDRGVKEVPDVYVNVSIAGAVKQQVSESLGSLTDDHLRQVAAEEPEIEQVEHSASPSPADPSQSTETERSDSAASAE